MRITVVSPRRMKLEMPKKIPHGSYEPGWSKRLMVSAQKAQGQLRVQEFLDDVADLCVCKEHLLWYNVDVATLLEGCSIRGHTTNPKDGSAILFLDSSVVSCHPRTGRLQHYPKSMVHCFVDDHRHGGEAAPDGVVFSVELFSISPRDEELCFILECHQEHEIPAAQREAARWLGLLNG